MAELIPDPRAVRVRLAAVSATPDDAPLSLSPEPAPLVMTNPTVGTGPLGGMAMAVPASASEPAVLAQRQVLLDGEPCSASLSAQGGGRHRLRAGDGVSTVILEPATSAGGVRTREVLVDGFRFLVEVESERIAALRERAAKGRGSGGAAGPLQVKAIIPGKVVAVSVGAGDEVTAGQQLLVVEAMKMQNELRAPRDGTIERVGVAVGENIEIGDLLVVIS
jgi:biotin carboxyl carrier protein